jgi:hypothetical protein
MNFSHWLEYFAANPERQGRLERDIDWAAPCTIRPGQRRALVRSFQRFELGESGDGKRLLAKAEAAGDPVYLDALRLLVAEEQRHSALFGRGLEHMGATSLDEHWSAAAFTRLRRALGLRTEIALFLIAETVAVGYFDALANHAPDPVLRGIGRRILTDEVEHVRFQIDRLRVGFRRTPAPVRSLVRAAWTVVAIGAATVLVIDHAGALRACELDPIAYWHKALRQFGGAARSALEPQWPGLLGPSAASVPK